jgi:hypothetical protein
MYIYKYIYSLLKSAAKSSPPIYIYTYIYIYAYSINKAKRYVKYVSWNDKHICILACNNDMFIYGYIYIFSLI